ncbi:helix-turn-helix domain-containing protein [Cupriavidus sp. DF5525]
MQTGYRFRCYPTPAQQAILGMAASAGSGRASDANPRM